MTFWQRNPDIGWSRRAERLNRGWLDAVLALLLFEAAFMLSIAAMLVLGAVTPAELVEPGMPGGIALLQWAIWFSAPFLLLYGLSRRLACYPLLYLVVSLIEHGAVYLPGLVWPATAPAGLFMTVLLFAFAVIDLAIVFYLFFGRVPRQLFRRRREEPLRHD